MNSNKSFTTNSNCSSFIYNKAKIRDGKLAHTLQSVKESICTVLEKEGDAKQDARKKMLIELQKFNEIQKERNIILQKLLERMENKNLKQIESSDEELL